MAPLICASCKRPRERNEVITFGNGEYVCRPTLRMTNAPDGTCFRRVVCWVGHHRIAA